MFHPDQLRSPATIATIATIATTRPRIAASVLLVLGGLVIAVSALAIGMAKAMVDAGIAARPADVALLNDLVAVLPLVVGFAIVDLAAAAGLARGRAWGSTIASIAAGIAVVIGSLGLVLVVAGGSPFAGGASRAGEADGVAIIGAFVGLYMAVLVALVADRPRIRLGSSIAA